MQTQTFHQEHQDWLSEIAHWEQELTFLSNITSKIQNRNVEESLQKAAGEFESQAYHQQMELKRLKVQIQNHEADMVSSGPNNQAEAQQHEEVRQVMRQFRDQFYELKSELFSLSIEAL